MDYSPPKSSTDPEKGAGRKGVSGAQVWALLMGLNAVLQFAEGSAAGVTAGVATLASAAALLKWPRAVRWVVVALPVAVGMVALLYLPYRFASLPNYPFFLGTLLLGLGAAVLLFGSFNPIRIAVAGPILAGGAWLTTKPTDGSALTADECSARVDLVAERLEPYRLHVEIVHQPDQPGIPPLPLINNAPLSYARRPLLEIGRETMFFGPRPLSRNPDTLAKEFAVFKRLLSEKKATEQEMNVFLDESLRVADAAPFLNVLTGIRVFALVRWNSPYDPQAVPEGAEELSRIFSEENAATARAQAIAAIAKYSSPCRTLGKKYDALNRTEPEHFYEVLIDSTVEGLRECECSWVNIDHLEYLVAQYVSDGLRPYAEVELPQSGDGALLLPKNDQQLVGAWLQQLAKRGAE